MDADADKIFDAVEQRGYNSSPSSTDSDGDGCPDIHEIGSVNGAGAVNSTDLLWLERLVAYPTALLVPPDSVQDTVLDLNKDGYITSTDVLMLARWVYLVEPPACI